MAQAEVLAEVLVALLEDHLVVLLLVALLEVLAEVHLVAQAEAPQAVPVEKANMEDSVVKANMAVAVEALVALAVLVVLVVKEDLAVPADLVALVVAPLAAFLEDLLEDHLMVTVAKPLSARRRASVKWFCTILIK